MGKHKGYCANCEECHVPPTGQKCKLSKKIWEDDYSDSVEDTMAESRV